MPNNRQIDKQDLQGFYHVATQRGFSRDYQARVTELVINNQPLDPDDLVYIKTFSLPATKTSVTSVKYYGVDIHSVALKDFGESTNWGVTFHADEYLTLKKWFEDRLSEIANNSTPQQGNTIFTQPRNPKLNPVSNETNYALIEVINSNFETVVKYKLYGLFIINVPGISYDMAGTGKAQDFTITFGYQYWKQITGDSVTQYESTTTGGFGAITPGGSTTGQPTGVLNTILGGLRTVTNVANVVRGTATAVRGAATSVRGAGRAIRGR